MNPLCSLALAAILPVSLYAQGARMPADFLPLDVGMSWTYELTDREGKSAGGFSFSVVEYTIVGGTSYYVLNGFPFVEETGEPVRLLRYDRTERRFLRRRGNIDVPLFLNEETEVLASDAAGVPQKFLLRTDAMKLTFQRGVGIVEAILDRPGGPVTARIVEGRREDQVRRGQEPQRGGPVATPRTQRGGGDVLIPPPVTPPNRRETIVASVTNSNPKLEVVATKTTQGYEFVFTVENTSDKLLPFQFNSGKTYDFAVVDASGKEVWRWSAGRFFTQVLKSDSIRAMSKWQYREVWNLKDNDGNAVPVGEYKVRGTLTANPQLQAEPVVLTIR